LVVFPGQRSPLFDSFIFGLVGLALIFVGFLTYSIYFGSNVVHFFLFLWNPSQLINFSPHEATILLSTLLPWLGIVEICLRGVYVTLPQKIRQYVLAFLLLTAILVLPLVLLWSVWQFGIFTKIDWSLSYLAILWMQLYYAISYLGDGGI